MKIKTHLKAGKLAVNHSETAVKVKAGGTQYRHDEALVARGLKVKTRIKAGFEIKKTSDKSGPA